MITLSYNSFLMIYLMFALSIVMIIWIYTHYKRKKRVFFSLEEHLRLCEFCHFSYVEKSIKNLNQCPQCGLYNKENDYDTNNIP